MLDDMEKLGDDHLRTDARDACVFGAFISYSHSDAKVARWLHGALENYRVPRSIVGTSGSLGLVPARIGRIFRDEEELGAAANLSPSIEEALGASAALIVICSPRSARSQWVGREISYFKRVNPDLPVLALIVEGVPGHQEAECFPDELKYRVLPDGTLDRSIIQEPLAPDLQKTDREVAKFKLIAGLTGLAFDSLVGRERRRTRRRILVAGISAAAIIATLATTIVFTVRAREQEASQRAAAVRAEQVAQQQRKAAIMAQEAAERSRDIARRQKDLADLATQRAETARRQALASAAEARKQQLAAEIATTEAQSRQAETLASQALAALGRGDQEDALRLASELKRLPPHAQRQPLATLAQSRVNAVPVLPFALAGNNRAIRFVPDAGTDISILGGDDRLHRVSSSGTAVELAFGAPPFLVRQDDSGVFAYSGTGESWRVDRGAPIELPRWSPVGLASFGIVREDGRPFGLTIDGRLVFAGEDPSVSPTPLTGIANGDPPPAAQLLASPDGSRVAVRMADGHMQIFDRSGDAIASAPLDELRLSMCVDSAARLAAICQASDGRLTLVAWDGTVAPISRSSFSNSRVLLPVDRGAAMQRVNGSVALIGLTDDAKPLDIARGASLVELGIWDDVLVDLLRPEPDVALMLFASGRIAAKDTATGTLYFEARVEGGLKAGRLAPETRELIVLTMDGEVRVVQLDAVWFNDWLGQVPDGGDAAPRAGDLAKIGSPLLAGMLSKIPKPAGLPEELVWSDGASALRLANYASGSTVLTVGDDAWEMGERIGRGQIVAGPNPASALIFSENRLYRLTRAGTQGIQTAEYAIDGDDIYTGLADENGTFLLVGSKGSVLVDGDKAILLHDPWPFPTTPHYYALNRSLGLLAQVDTNGRTQISHLASGAEIVRAFGAPAGAQHLRFSPLQFFASGPAASLRALRLPTSRSHRDADGKSLRVLGISPP
jgi:hypothetical protein